MIVTVTRLLVLLLVGAFEAMGATSGSSIGGLPGVGGAGGSSVLSGGAVPANTRVAYSNGTALTGDDGLTYAANSLTIGDGTTIANAIANGAAGSTRGWLVRTNGVNRWFQTVNTTAEAGADAGSDYQLVAYSDLGVSLGSVFTIARVTGGTFTIARPVSLAGNFTMTSGVISQTVTDSATATLTPVATFAHLSSGTVANSFGSTITMQAPDDGGTLRNMGFLDCYWSTAAAATRTSLWQWRTIVSGVTTTAATLGGTAFNLLAGFKLVVADTTEATSVSAAAMRTAGGLGVAARSFLGTIGSTFKGNVIAGVQDGTAAVSGERGEVPTASVVSSYTNYTSDNVLQEVTNLTLGPGQWRIRGFLTFKNNSATVTTSGNITLALSTTTASTTGTTEGAGDIAFLSLALNNASGKDSMYVDKDVLITTSTTYYLNTLSRFSAGNPQYVGSITAMRTR